MENKITVYNIDREPYYNLSVDKFAGKYTIYFTITILEDIVLYLSIYELVSLQNYLYTLYNSDTLLEPIVLNLSPCNKYMQGYIIMEPYSDYGHMIFYEGISLSVTTNNNNIFNGFIDIEDVQTLYNILQNLIISNTQNGGNSYV